ncbi:MAG TPA: amidase [Acidimicrobiales bacterium]|nr:amidase [Acidimicrobiales bacterium]
MSDAFDVGRLDGVAQADLLKRGEVTAQELVEWAIERADALNPQLNAIVCATYDDAQAHSGVPIVLKDLVVEVPGVPISEGSRFVHGTVSNFESELVTRYRRGGFAFIGKTNLPEFGMAVHCAPALFGATLNPWSAHHTTAGSSGGSAAAVAAGIVPIAHASDAGGSIRYPASCCGLFGLKPTRARNPLGPEYGDALGGFATEHVLTRTVRDSAWALDVTSGPAPGDPYWAPPPARPFVHELNSEPGRLRIAFSRDSAEETALHPDCLDALDATIALLDALGHELVEAPFTQIDQPTGAAIDALMGGATAWVVEYWTRRLGRPPQPGELEPPTEAMLEQGRRIGAGEWLLARDDINAYTRRAAAWFEQYDLFLCPTVTTPPLLLGDMDAHGADMIRNAGVIANLTGNPAMSVPLYWNGDGLPIGSHFLAPFGDEATLLRLAAQLETAQPWADNWPPASVVG